MSNRLFVAVTLLLGFTGVDLVWADGAHHGGGELDVDEVFEITRDPEPKARNGPAMRFGSAVGYTMFAGHRVDSLGGYVSAAWQVGRFAVEADYGYFRMHEQVHNREFSGNVEIGRFHRASVSGRLDVLRLGRDFVGENTKLIFWLEGGVGRQAGYFNTGESFQRNDVTGGFGWLLDHRLKKPLGFPSRVGWHFGWRLVRTGVPTLSGKSIVCKAPVCSYDERDNDIGLLVSSGMHLSW